MLYNMYCVREHLLKPKFCKFFLKIIEKMFARIKNIANFATKQ